MGTKSNAYSAAPRRNVEPPLLGHHAVIPEGSCEGSARKDADEVGYVSSDGGFGIWRGGRGRRVEATQLRWVYVGGVGWCFNEGLRRTGSVRALVIPKASFLNKLSDTIM